MKNVSLKAVTLIALLLFVTASFLGCKRLNMGDGFFNIFSKPSISSDTNAESPVSYGPNALPSDQTEEKTKEHERRLKIIDENGGVREGINFVGTYAGIDDEGNLVVDGYMRNFTGYEIYNISGNITVESADTQEYIAAAYFEFTEETFGSLRNGKSRPWRLIFDSDYVNAEATDLSRYTVTTEFNFDRK